MLKILTILILLSFQIYSGEQEIKAYMKQQNSKLDNKTADRIYKNVIYYSKQYNVDPVLVFSVMKTESHFRHSTLSSAGARGLMQLMPFNFKEFDVDNSIEGNIKGGVMHLKRDYERTKNITKTLVCYNAGCGRLKNNEWHKIKETTDYITKINNVYPEIKKLYYTNLKVVDKTIVVDEDFIDEVEETEEPRKLTKQEKFQRNRIGFKRNVMNESEEKNDRNFKR
ncbi:transglycosylase SLT domain-containing protein [Sebaldella sp. S0638]|uniref:transglycosylase SLT domain-containing protein n=1 Tax=Sebaldella sp. S0638 TaxID=2957809 RepID=UPI0020A059C9|nr:transglycosylase SLT domain-containing protein [Sebaldella sp. S0638]MCP1225493.1 transglycosylase SLT domain-containing protein [Sebaldella sp. S0638]